MEYSTAIIIDDEPEITQVYSELLESQNLKILGIGANGHDAIRLFTEYSPNLVFLDVHMPDLNGIEALKEIKKISSITKVIMITGDLSENLEQLCKYNGADAIIFKPFNIEKIMKLLEMIKVSESIVIQR